MQAEADEQNQKLASQAEAQAALQQQVQQQAAVMATLQTQIACVTQPSGAQANISQQAAATPGETEAETNPSHRADDYAHDDSGSVSQQVLPSSTGRRRGEQGGVAWRTRWFTVRWSGGPHRFL